MKSNLGLRAQNSGAAFQVCILGFWVSGWGLGFWASGLGFRVYGLGFWVSGLGSIGFGFRVQGLGFGLGVKNLCNYSGVHSSQ